MQRNYWPTAQWQTADAANLAMDVGKLAALESVIESEYSNMNGIVVVRNGYIAYEKYFHGFGPEDAHHVTSVTKSVLSALIGIAIDKGYIRSVEQKVLDFFPDKFRSAGDAQKREVTIRHLLTMTAPYPFDDWQEPLDQLCMQPDWAEYVLDQLGQNGSLGAFKYSSAGAHLLSAILTRSTGRNARVFANDYLFRLIGMREIRHDRMDAYGFEDLFGAKVRGWVEDPSGNSTGGWGLTLTPRDMARFGFLYLNRGVWDHRQIVPGAWIDGSTAFNPNRYGYLWWVNEADGTPAYLAVGDGGNVICCLPEHDLVVAIASAFAPNPRDRWTLIQEHIIPAITRA